MMTGITEQRKLDLNVLLGKAQKQPNLYFKTYKRLGASLKIEKKGRLK